MRKPKRTLKKIPTFESEDAEREFWETADSTEYVDWSAAYAVRFPSLRRGARPAAAKLRPRPATQIADASKNQDIIDTSGQSGDLHDKP